MPAGEHLHSGKKKQHNSTGDQATTSEQSVYYDGDAEVGINIKIHFLGAVEDLNIYALRTRRTMEINTDKVAAIVGSPIAFGDDIYISTVKGEKSIYLVREGVEHNILNALDKNVDWFYIMKGDNLFTYTATSGLTNLQFQVTHQLLYEGV